ALLAVPSGSRRRPLVAWLSSAARSPLPGATRARAVPSRVVVAITRLLCRTPAYRARLAPPSLKSGPPGRSPLLSATPRFREPWGCTSKELIWLTYFYGAPVDVPEISQ